MNKTREQRWFLVGFAIAFIPMLLTLLPVLLSTLLWRHGKILQSTSAAGMASCLDIGVYCLCSTSLCLAFSALPKRSTATFHQLRFRALLTVFNHSRSIRCRDRIDLQDLEVFDCGYHDILCWALGPVALSAEATLVQLRFRGVRFLI